MNSVSLWPNDFQMAVNCTAYTFFRKKNAVITCSMGREHYYSFIFSVTGFCSCFKKGADVMYCCVRSCCNPSVRTFSVFIHGHFGFTVQCLTIGNLNLQQRCFEKLKSRKLTVNVS